MGSAKEEDRCHCQQERLMVIVKWIVWAGLTGQYNTLLSRTNSKSAMQPEDWRKGLIHRSNWNDMILL